jgi:hypothetical protein
MDPILFHVMLKDARIVVFLMKDGVRQVYLPGRKAVSEMWPLYEEHTPILEKWFELHREVECAGRVVHPGDPDYARRLAEALSKDPLLRAWAYVSALHIQVTFNQVAVAAGRDRSPAVREAFAKQGLAFIKNGGRYVVPLSQVQRVLGAQVADRVLLNVRQVADFLGLSSPSASKLIRKHGLALYQGRTKVPWGLVRRIRRVGRRRFCVPEAGSAGDGGGGAA